MKNNSRTPYLLLSGLLVLFFTHCKKDNTLDLERPPVVNAGPSQTIKLPVDSVRLSGSAQDSDSRIVAYLWSEVSGPNVPVIGYAGSPSALVTGLTAGTYIFQLMATDSLGETGVDTMTVTVLYPKLPTTVTLHVAGTFANPYEIHYMGNSVHEMSDPLAPELDAGTWTVNGELFYVRAAFRFDLSGLPTNTPVQSAKLTLYSNPTPINGDHVSANSGPANAFYIRRINSNWAPLTTSWLSQPGTDTTAQVLIPHTNAGFLDVNDVDVTTMVNNMITTGNYGFKIQLQNEALYNIRVFCSARYSDSTKYPKLVVNY